MIRDETPVVGWLPGENKNKKLYDATMTGDEAYVDRLRDTYSDYDSYKTALRKALRENDPRIKEAADALNRGDTETYKGILAEMVDEGHFDEAIIEGAIDAEATAGYNDLRDDSRIKESAMAFLLGNEAKRIELEKSVLAEGEYKADIIYKARKAEADYVKTRLTEAKEYIKKGKPEEAEAIYKSLINKGYTREFIDAYIQKIK
jgi:thioredoxin-like negative regulator of GroEL